MGAVTFVERVTEIFVNPILALIFTLALLYFLWGVFIFIANSEQDSARETGKQHMLWGIIGMTIMVSVFGILRIGLETFDIGPADIPADLPDF
jgi:hypothetical protein